MLTFEKHNVLLACDKKFIAMLLPSNKMLDRWNPYGPSLHKGIITLTSDS